MLATSWNAKGLVRPIWQRLDVPTERREELARLTGIPATNLSAMNTGRMPMTLRAAQRIVEKVPGVSVLDLGAPEEADVQEAATLRSRLEALEAQVEEGFRAVEVAISELAARLPAQAAME